MRCTLLKILIDLDDTIEHLLSAWVDYLNSQYGTSVRQEDITQWDLQIAFPSLTKEQIHAPLEKDEFWQRVKPMEGAAEAIQCMQKRGYQVYIVTASAYRTIRPKMEQMLFKHFPFLTWDNVIVTNHKQIINGDILIDDAPHNLVSGNYVQVLMSAPHNKSFDAEANGMIRVSNWDEVTSIIEGIEIEKRLSQETINYAMRYRQNPDLFAEEVLGLKLKPHQRKLLQLYSKRLGFKIKI